MSTQLDFMENMSWTLGPEDEHNWWWATVRESIAVVVVRSISEHEFELQNISSSYKVWVGITE